MWTKLTAVCSLFFVLFCNSRIEGEKIIDGDQEKKCVYASSDYQKIDKISKYFNIKFDEIEKQGISFYFLMSSNNVEFAFHNSLNNVTFPLVRIEENVFLVPEKKVYFGIKSYEKGEASIWLEKNKNNLFKEYEMVGYVSKRDTPINCLDRAKINTIYEERKNELSAGPEPDGGYFKLEVGYNTITNDNVIVREKPSKESKAITKLKLGTTVALLEDTNIVAYVKPYGGSHWVKVRLEDGKIGYVFGAFVKWKESFPDGYKLD